MFQSLGAAYTGITNGIAQQSSQWSEGSLLDDKRLLTLLDRCSDSTELLQSVADKHAHWSSLAKQAATSPAEIEQRIRDVAYWIGEFDELTYPITEYDSIFNQCKTASEMQDITTALGSMDSLLNEGDASIESKLDALCEAAERIGKIDTLEHLTRDAHDLRERARELGRATRSASMSELLDDDFDLQKAEQWLHTVDALARKHERGIEDLPELEKQFHEDRESLQEQLANHQNAVEECEKARAMLEEACKQLSAERKKQAEILAGKVTGLLPSLGLQQGCYSIEFSSVPASQLGTDKLTALFSPRTTTEPRPIAKSASSGEQARLMLAVTLVIAEHTNVPLLMLDEADAGLGADTASELAQLLHRITGNLQLLVITHQAQLAAEATSHIRVAPPEAQQTHASLYLLDSPELRVDEISRMLGSSEDEALRSAAEAMIAQ